MALTNAERQAAFRARQKDQNQLSAAVIERLNTCLEIQEKWYEETEVNTNLDNQLLMAALDVISLLGIQMKTEYPDSETAKLAEKVRNAGIKRF